MKACVRATDFLASRVIKTHRAEVGIERGDVTRRAVGEEEKLRIANTRDRQQRRDKRSLVSAAADASPAEQPRRVPTLKPGVDLGCRDPVAWQRQLVRISVRVVVQFRKL